MDFILDDYIDNYIQDAEAFDRKVAKHLKEIIPNTIHLDENTFIEIIEDLKKEMDKGTDFKEAFNGICEIYFLKGDDIKAGLPDIVHKNLKLADVLQDIELLEDRDDQTRSYR